MKALIYKEICLMKKQVKQCVLSVVAIIALNAFFIMQDSPITQITFTLPVLASMILAVQFINATVLSEKRNKTYEKMFTVYTLGEIIFTKVVCVGCVMSVFSCVYNIVIKLIMQYFFKYNVNYDNLGIEIVIQLLVVWIAVSTFATVYVVCNNQALISFVSTATSLLLSMISIYISTGAIKLEYIIIAIVAVVAVIFLEMKVLTKINIDKIMRD